MKTRTFIGMAVMLMAFMSITKAHGQEQGEYAYKKMTSQQGDTLLSESPVETTSKLSRMETIYKLSTDIRLCEGDLITGVTFKGYNPGKEQTRHLSVWMRNDYELRMPGDFTSVDEMTKVYEGDCKILHGGTANIPEDILNIKFDTPVAYVNPNHLRLTIMSEGEASSDSVLFLHFKGRFVSSLCATSGDSRAGVSITSRKLVRLSRHGLRAPSNTLPPLPSSSTVSVSRSVLLASLRPKCKSPMSPMLKENTRLGLRREIKRMHQLLRHRDIQVIMT